MTYAFDLYTARDYSEPFWLVLLVCGRLLNITWCQKVDKLTLPEPLSLEGKKYCW